MAWVKAEMDVRGWSQSELARRGKFTPAAINKILSRERLPGVEICRNIARAFGMPDIDVLRIAGLADPEVGAKEESPSAHEMLSDFNALSKEDRDKAQEYVRALRVLRGQETRRKKAADDSK